MSKKVTFYFFAALVFLTSSVVGMNGEGTPKNKLQHPVTPGTDDYFTPEQDSVEQRTAFNRVQAELVNKSESDEKNDESSLEQRGGKAKILEVLHGNEAHQQLPRGLFQTPDVKLLQKNGVQSESRFKSQHMLLRIKQDNDSIDVHELERSTWLGNAQGVTPFSQTQTELVRWMAQKDAAGEKKLKEEIEDPQKIKAVREAFVTMLEEYYGRDFTNELFAEGEKEKFLEQQEPLPLEDVTSLIARADALMEKGRSYLTECQKIEAPVQEALDALNITQEQAQQAQENYDALEGSPFQHGIAALWCATRTAMGVVSTGTVIVLIVVYHQGITIVMGVAASVAGFIIDPSNLHRFLGFLWIPDNFNNTRTSWRKFREARAASSALDEKQQELQSKREEVEKLLSDFATQKEQIAAIISPALKKEIDQSVRGRDILELQKKIEAFREQK
ncbi:MAG: hypothetical protein NT164_05105 [Verrucomicrobiae bacterium]|nr:hypothetical protein [Verrucomicrobiae bacterium]